MTRRLALAVAAATAALAGGCSGGTAAAKPGVVRVVAAENFWGDIASQIGGSHVAVTSIISNPNTDPHAYQSDPRDAGALATAQLVITNGLGYDGFIDKALAAVGGHRRVLAVQNVLHLSADVNPHVWYWTARVPQVADAIAQQLTKLDPADSRTFGKGLTKFLDSLEPLTATIESIKARYAGAKIAYTERVPGYLVRAAGLVLGSPASFAQAIEDGNDPSPGDVATFDRDITDHTVKVLLYNAQVVDAATTRIKQLAISSHIPVVGVTETMPSHTTFQAWQLRQDRELLRALGG
ncbi:MAG: metal ABC transporter solute-binding protein, Zn/Mn family [Mycobacteriales bacterium]